MAPADWYYEGGRRLCGALLVGAVFGGLTYFANHRWVTPVLPSSPRLGTRSAIFFTSCIVLSGAAGASWFVITKPFM